MKVKGREGKGMVEGRKGKGRGGEGGKGGKGEKAEGMEVKVGGGGQELPCRGLL